MYSLPYHTVSVRIIKSYHTFLLATIHCWESKEDHRKNIEGETKFACIFDAWCQRLNPKATEGIRFWWGSFRSLFLFYSRKKIASERPKSFTYLLTVMNDHDSMIMHERKKVLLSYPHATVHHFPRLLTRFKNRKSLWDLTREFSDFIAEFFLLIRLLPSVSWRVMICQF